MNEPSLKALNQLPLQMGKSIIVQYPRQASPLEILSEMTLGVQARFCYLSGLLQVIMVGGDGCEDRNHCQLYVRAGKSLRGLLQALRYQPVCHL